VGLREMLRKLWTMKKKPGHEGRRKNLENCEWEKRTPKRKAGLKK